MCANPYSICTQEGFVAGLILRDSTKRSGLNLLRAHKGVENV